MELIHNLSLGFGVATTSPNLLLAMIGCLLGTLSAVLPGMGPVATMAMLLPFSYALPPLSALILLIGVACGTQYGGSSAARWGGLLMVTLFTLVLVALAPALSRLALGATETVALMVLGLVAGAVLASGSLLKALAMLLLGLLLGLVGADSDSGAVRFAWDVPELSGGLGIVAIAMGVFGCGEVITHLARPADLRELPSARGPVSRDKPLGSLLALGIPSHGVMALLLGAMALRQMQPGAQALGSNTGLFWGLLASLWLVNLMLLALHLPLARRWARLPRLPYRWLFPAIVLLCALAAYAEHHSSFDIWLVAAFGCIGYGFHQLDMEPAPLLLGFILGPVMEENLRRALQLSGGDWSVFVARPLSAGLLATALCLVALLPVVRARRA